MQQLVDNRYRPRQRLGGGGMAEVYLAHDDVLDRDVALKVMSGRYAGDEEFVERFKREAQSAAALSHPNIVSIFDRGDTGDGTYYIAMEYLPGGTLKDRILKRGALPARTAAAVALQIAEALRAAHGRDVIHRDIKPHNILITASGDVKVTDFGIARAASSSTMTRTGHILGTAHYISPEQAMGEPVGPASDLYSLGVVLYEMLTGVMPFDADTPLGIAMKHVNGHPVPPRELNPEVPEGINAVTMRLLAKNPKDRYGNDAELIEDLERVLAGLDPADATTEMAPAAMPAAHKTRALPRPAPRRAGPQRKRRRAGPLLLALLGLLLLATLAWAGFRILGDGQHRPAPPPAAAMVLVPDLVGMDLERAEDRFGKDFEIETEKVEAEEPVDTIVSQDPKTGGEAREGSTISVEVVGTRVADVPGVVGRDRASAEGALRDAGFEVTTEREESSPENEGLVTRQDPAGGESAEAGSEVEITVGTGPDEVEVPDVTGGNVAQARSILGRSGLALGAVVEDYSDTVPEGSIISQDPAGGESLEPDGEVGVTVSLGVEQVAVPEVYGVGVAQAQAILANAGINSNPIEVPGDEPAGTALSTEPGVGALVDPGSTLPLYFSAGPPEPTTVASPEPTTVTEPETPEAPATEAPAPPEDGAGITGGLQRDPADDNAPQRPPRQNAQNAGGPGNSGPGGGPSSGPGGGGGRGSGRGEG